MDAVFNELIRTDQLENNLIQKIRKLKHDQPELSFLTDGQCKELLSKLKSKPCDAYVFSLICLSTGVRWSEAESLEGKDVIQKRNHHLITFSGTKNSKNRSVPITSEVVKHFKRTEGKLFKYSYKLFEYSCIHHLSFELPDRQLTHILRRTFASHFIMKGGNMLVLQRILGHH